MKLFIKRLFFFTVVTILAYILILLLFSKLDKLTSMFSPNLNYRVAKGGHLYTRLKDIEHYSHVELLVIGSSHAYRGFDPRIFKKKGVEIFNLGSSAQTPIQTEILIKRYLDKLNPKVVLFEVYPGSLTSDGVESSLDLVSN